MTTPHQTTDSVVSKVSKPKTNKSQQSGLLSAFDKVYDNANRSIRNVARAYKACVDAGIDMAKQRGISSDIGKKFLLIASGRLTELTEIEVLHMPLSTLRAMSSLPLKEQQKAINSGIEVMREGKARTVPLLELTKKEVAQAIDTTSAVGRIVPATEQMKKTQAATRPADHLVTVTFTYPQYQALHVEVQKRGTTIQTFVKNAALREAKITQ